MPLSEIPLAPRLLVLTLGGDTPATSWGANCTAYAGERGTLLVDPLIAPAHARLVAEAVARRGFPPVTDVLLTHHHTDHALGAGWFAARGARVACHRRCAEAMAAQHPGIVAARRADPALAALFADAEPHAPATRFDDRLAVDLGGAVAEARHLGHGHTPGDAVVVFPAEGVVAAGDLLFVGYHYNYEEADPDRLPAALASLAALGAGRIVPGHGPVGGPELVAGQARYHEAVARAVAEGPTAEAARQAILARFPGLLLPWAVDGALARRWPS